MPAPLRTRSARRSLRTGALLLAVGILAGCGAGPQAVGESGVDGLTIPTPGPRAADFAPRVDNPWLPLAAGSSWTWEQRRVGRTRTVTDSVLAATRSVVGVRTTVVERVVTRPSGAVASRTRRFYAQDLSGNVWLFGSEGGASSWQAGRDGAEAGLAMPATPRVGDGWPLGLAPGVFEDVATVLSVSTQITGPDGSPTDALVLEYTSALAADRRERVAYVMGAGPVQMSSEDGTTWRLVDHGVPSGA